MDRTTPAARGEPTRKEARELMTSPVVSCTRSATVPEVAGLMAERGISSVAVLEADGTVAGLVTERDLVSKVLAMGLAGQSAGQLRAEAVMEPEPARVAPGDFFYQVLLTMVRRRVKHALVIEGGRAVGIVTMRDLVRSRNLGVLSVVADIEHQESVTGLGRAVAEVDQVLKATVAEEAPVPEIFSLMTEFYDRLTRKVLQLCEHELAAEGLGPPPSPYCWIVMGSGGRKEQILRTDQDSAVIYQEAPPGRAEEAGRYFRRLAEKAVEGLATCGFRRCKGNVMASNPAWCRPLPEWQALLAEWTRHPEPEHVRLLSIFLDFRPVYGEEELAQALRTFVLDLFASFPVILRLLAVDDAASPVPLGPWGLIMGSRRGPHRGRINLKTAVCVHLVDCLRLLALKHRIAETSTLGRLRNLTDLGLFGAEESAGLSTAYQDLVFFRLRQNLHLALAGEEPDDWLNPKTLTRRERGRLVSALKAAARLQNLTARSFLVYWG
jgi:CBS domain-containing protein